MRKEGRNASAGVGGMLRERRRDAASEKKHLSLSPFSPQLYGRALHTRDVRKKEEET